MSYNFVYAKMVTQVTPSGSKKDENIKMYRFQEQP